VNTNLKRITPEADGVLKDGQILRVPHMMMDGEESPAGGTLPIMDAAGYPARSLVPTDEQRDATLERQRAYDARVSNAWKRASETADGAPIHAPAACESTLSLNQLQSLQSELQAKYDRRISNAWKGER
jgi:hypothetical protein